MLSRILKYLGEHALATTALICALAALAGSSYAAFTISGSQIRNHSIDPVKLNPKFIAWECAGLGIGGTGRTGDCGRGTTTGVRGWRTGQVRDQVGRQCQTQCATDSHD